MKPWILAATAFTLGLAIGEVANIPPRTADNRAQNYLRLLSIYALAKQYEHHHGALPSTMVDLEKWCRLNATREDIFEESESFVTPSGDLSTWRIRSKGEKKDVFIYYSKGQSSDVNLGVSFDGEIKSDNP
ncbi:hypothetical protein [Verrucomicrobium sp. BvORR106]|uniref:hypothetical protein n=1 Tax=Verrucomicrobium sp. BvORR106 TaxID=1403819 RepID=UPI00224103E5|nr:hypothetical protein [Verrucomicrobium sp. BvORR106]